MVTFFIGFGYVFLLDQGAYLNQYYLVLIFAFILSIVPSGRGYSVDSFLHAADAHTQVPQWSVLLLRIQMEVVLVYAGLVKLNEDWLRGEPISTWFADRGHWPLIGDWLSEPVVGLAAAYGIIVLHLVGAPLLLWRRARLPVFAVYLVFHLASATIFTIGLFSWITLLGTLMFFDPDWPRTLWRRLGGHAAPRAVPMPIEPVRPLVLAGLGLFLAVQMLFPARHWLYPGDVAWTGEGRSFAWRMKLHQREGQAHFIVRDPDSDRVWRVDPVDYLSARAATMLPGEPDQILQFAHYLQARWKADYDLADVQVHADVKLSLNGRSPQPLVDSTLDLTHEHRHLGHYRWILPLKQMPNPKAPQPQPM